MARQRPASSPVLLLFLGGTIELSLFVEGLSTRQLQRYVVSLADIDVGTLVQMGSGRAVPRILTQVVPNPQSSTLPSVRDYRASLKIQFDEKPSQISLAGFLAGRYVFPVLARMERTATRENVLLEFERRPSEDIGGSQMGFTASQQLVCDPNHPDRRRAAAWLDGQLPTAAPGLVWHRRRRLSSVVCCMGAIWRGNEH
ncbi:MAG TPA: hypothetical protein VIV60_27440, partial [Polyangiaceae bacterium]